MPRRPTETVIALAAIICAGTLLDSRGAEAQGLLRRIQSRIQSRIAIPPVNPPAGDAQAAEPAAASAPTAPPITANRDPATLQGKRIPPLVPSRDDVESSRFGGSILAPFPEPPTRASADTTDRPTLGIEVLPSDSEPAGVRVVRIRSDSLADDAGLRIDDIIVSIDGVDTPTIEAVSGELSRTRIGQKIQARVLRGKQTFDLAIPFVSRRVVAAKPDGNSNALGGSLLPTPVNPTDVPDVRLGVNVSNADGIRGAVVTTVTPGTSGAAAGLEVGDRIVSLDGMLIADASALRTRLAGVSDGDQFSLQLVRGDELMIKDLQLGKPGIQGVAGASAERAPSALQGLGSMLGGLLGGQPAPKAQRKGDPSGEDQSRKESGSDNAGRARGDDPTLRRVGFGEGANVSGTPTDGALPAGPLSLTQDPPSLEVLELPTPVEIEPISPISIDRDNAPITAEEIRREIRRLEARLRALEADKPRADATE